MHIPPLYEKIWQKAQPLLARGRFYDLWHTEISIAYMQQILKGEKKENLEPILVPAIILHDIGWSKLGEDKNTSWNKKEMRITHMQEGAILADQILNDLHYDQILAKQIVQLVATHDNAYLGIEPQTQEEKLLRDADACFILTALSFWKDYHVKSKGINPNEFLNQQIIKYRKRFTKTAQIITDQQILERKSEIADLSITSEQRFKQLKSLAIQKNQRVL